VVWVVADWVVAEEVRVVAVGDRVAGAKAVVVVDVPVVAAVVVVEAEWGVVEDPEAAVIAPAVVVEAVRAVVVKAAAAVAVDGRAAAADPVADPAVVVAAARDRAVSRI
jgi:hypothetical protein